MVCLPTFPTKKTTINVGKYAIYMGCYGAYIFDGNVWVFFRFRCFTKKNMSPQVAAGSPEVVKVVELMSSLGKRRRTRREFSLSGEGRTSWTCTIWVFPKIGKHPKMDGENNGKPNFLMDDLGGKPTTFGNIYCKSTLNHHLGEYCFTFSRHFIADPSQHGGLCSAMLV